MTESLLWSPAVSRYLKEGVRRPLRVMSARRVEPSETATCEPMPFPTPETLDEVDEMKYVIPPDGPLGEKRGVWYTEGDCWAFALALHRMTGWPMTALGYADEASVSYEDRGWVHIVVRTPDDRLLDVRGLRDEDSCAREFLWSNYAFFEVTARELLIDFEEDDTRDPSPVSLSHAPDWATVQEDARRLLAELPELPSLIDGDVVAP